MLSEQFEANHAARLSVDSVQRAKIAYWFRSIRCRIVNHEFRSEFFLASVEWSQAEVERWLESQDLRYQQIELPHGLRTEGSSRMATRKIVLADVNSKSVLDVGSYLGLFCIEALRKGASSATGYELDNSKIEQAETIADICGVGPTFMRKNIDKDSIEGKFDVVLLLNVLHHTFDPISVLRKLAYAAKQKMYVEIATLQGNELRKIEPLSRVRFLASLWSSIIFRRLVQLPSMVAMPVEAGRPIQTYLLTESLVRTALQKHMTLFHSIEKHTVDYKSRIILELRKLNFDHLVVVAGANSAGKSTLIDKIRSGNQYSFDNFNNSTPLLSPDSIQKRGVENIVPAPYSPAALLHYDLLSALVKRKNYSFARDPILDLLHCAENLTVILVAPSLDTLKAALLASESNETGDLSNWHQLCFQKYSNSAFVRDLYVEFVQFVQVSRPNSTFRIYSWQTPERAVGYVLDSMGSEISAEEAISLLGSIYK